MMDFKPNFRKAYSNANSILLVLDDSVAFPFSVTKVVEDIIGIPCCSYERALKYGLKMEDFGSESAIIQEFGGKTQMFYNSKMGKEHARFSILHELGHFVNNHDYECKSSDIYGVQEVEANYFAAQLLMPEQMINEFVRRGEEISVDFLMKNFGVSRQAAQKRRDTLNKIKDFKRTEDEQLYDDLILKKNISFLDSISHEKKSLDWIEEDYELELERNRW